MKKIKIPITGPSITSKEIEYVTDAITNGWYNRAFDYIHKFEQEFAKYVGTAYAIATPSCTSALHLSLLALNIGKNDEVIVPEITWTASAAAITYVGATPIFVDVDPKTWCITPEAIEKAITSKTKAIMVVDLYGNMPEMEDIKKIGQQYSLPIIEDAAEAFGSSYKNQKAGSLGDTGCFSFHGTKTLTTGEGGMLVTSNKDLYDRIIFLQDLGRGKEDRNFWFTEIGYKYKMSNIQAALGLAQLERHEELITKKRTIFEWYQEALASLSEITLNYSPDYIFNTYWMPTIIFDKKLNITKEECIQKLKEYGITTRPFFYPLSMMPAYKDYTFKKNYSSLNPISYSISSYGINVPSPMNLAEENAKYICNVIKKLIEAKKRSLYGKKTLLLNKYSLSGR